MRRHHVPRPECEPLDVSRIPSTIIPPGVELLFGIRETVNVDTRQHW